MSKRLISGVLIGLAILLVVFFSVGYPADFPRHKNPSQIQEEVFFPIQLISIYAQVVSLQVAGKWDLASSKLKKTFLSYLPESLRYIFTRFNELIQATGDKLKKVKEGIDSSEALLRQGKIQKAGKMLEKTWVNLLKAERDLDNLNSSVDELRGKIGSSAAERLRKEISPLSRLAREYKNKIQNLYREAKEGRRLKSTFLEIFVAEKKVVVGGFFEVYGKLKTEKGKVLARRSVDIFLEKKRIFKTITDENGEFGARINFPFLYKKYAQLFASFTPQGEDKERFYPSISRKVLLEPIFYTPLIEVNYQEPVYPVLPFKIQGKLTLESVALANYPVKIKVAQRIVKVSTDKQGKFQTRLSLPAGVGKTFPLSIFTPSRGIIAPASLTVNLPVSYKIPSMMIDLPLAVFPPFPLQLKGEVNLKDQLAKDAVVKVITENEDITTNINGKSFKVRVNIPLFRFSGWERIRVLLYPRQAWILPLNRKEKVLVINPLTLFPFFTLLALFISISRRKEKEVEEAQGVSERREKLPPEEKIVEEKELTKLIRIYTRAVDLVANLTGIKQAPYHTVREYLKLVKGKLEKKAKDFEFISSITEKFLYAPAKVSEEEVVEAEKRLSRLIG